MDMECFGLIKFQDEVFLNSLYEKGLIYLNPISYFKNIEDQRMRGDKDENLTSILQPGKTSIFLSSDAISEKVEIKDLSGPIKIYNPTEDKIRCTHIFSMASLCYGDEVRSDGKVFDQRVCSFGDSLLCIYNVKEFFNRLIASLDKLIGAGEFIFCKSGRVAYIDSNFHHGKVDIFHKFVNYSWQKEWRLAVSAPSANNQPVQFKIGSLCDISIKISCENFKNIVGVNNEQETEIIF